MVRIGGAYLLVLCLAPAQPKPDLAALEKTALQELKDTNTPGAEIAIVEGDRVAFAKGFGVADVETGAAMTPDLLCRIGSTTKMLTAAVLVGLAEEGKLDLDQPIGKYVSGLSPKISRITAQQLLTHTAGLHDEARMYGSHDDSALGTTLRSWKDDFLFAEPGSIYSYANPGYHLAGLVIEEVGGKPYADMMAERLFEPLGMKRTTLRPFVAMTWPLAQGHEGAPNRTLEVIRPFADNTATWPAGSVFTSAKELARFAIAFMNDGILDGKQAIRPGVIEKLATPRVPVPGSPAKYGYGLTIRDYRGVRLVEHGGARSGYGSFVRMAPQQRFAVILLVNKSGGMLPKTLQQATEMFLPLGPEPAESPKQELALGAAEMQQLAGKYRNGESTTELFIKDGKLYAKRFPVTLELKKTGADRLAAPGMEIVVVRDKLGAPKYLFGGGRALRKID